MPRIASSIVNYDSRGPWGSASFHGNTTGYLVQDLLDTLVPDGGVVVDPMEGSGTTRDLIDSMDKRIYTYFGYDLSAGYDILDQTSQRKIRDEVGAAGMADFIFWHPPYWDMVIYNKGNSRDFSAGPYPQYLTRMRQAAKFLRTIAKKDARLAILIGDRRSYGRYYWLAADVFQTIPTWGLESLVIRQQRAVSSGPKRYEREPIRIMHEYIGIFR